MKANAAARPADRRKLILYVTLAVVVLGIVVAVGMASRVPKAATEVAHQAHLKIGQQAPEFAVSTTAGAFDLATAQTPVFLEVFATWCPHCQREVTVLNALSKQYGSRISFVGVSGSALGMDGNTPESQADVVAFAQQYGVAYPVAYDPELKVANQYMQTGFPTIVVIKKDKTISAIRDGEIPKALLEKDILGAL
ncbi:MAG: TlpA family protein disulfide reductase [Candidatus Velthaea sp.]